MRFASFPTLAALAALVLSTATACSPQSSEPCMPACRASFECIRGACVTSCNPPCTAGQTCTGSSSSARCISNDAATGNDTGTTPDVSSPADATDTPVSSDAPAMDVPVASDIPVNIDAADSGIPATDVPVSPDATGMDVPRDAPPPCGRTGEPCCGAYCAPGNECLSAVCRAIVRTAGECVSPADCPAGQTCQGPTVCGGHGCFQCAASAGTTAFGAACAMNTDCATGLCFRNRCTIACAIGGTGDADCNARSAGYVCTQLNFRTGPAGMTSTVTLGVCRQGCARNADCGSGLTCLATSNTPADRLDFVCGASAGTGAAGSACVGDSGFSEPSRCSSLICIYPTVGDLVCTAPCITSADCPATAPRCIDLSWLRPSGGIQPGRACSP